ncbi:hypothetical protein Hypma_003468 [Hypsizygus marmoreus]|uniref:Uncharacterized protein n=1 Tax=Hypsizygus marmoreus TaxID=39966 RepID=A0A369J618_HYPMA|nr:hypothetical protein Hypma_003468 [Hypsizygus marmoreus]
MRSTTKAVENIPLPPTRKAPRKKPAAKPDKQASEKRKAPVTKSSKRGQATAAPDEPEPDEPEPDEPEPEQPEVDIVAGDELRDSLNKTFTANARPKPTPRTTVTTNPDNDETFMSTRRGWRRPSPGTQHPPQNQDTRSPPKSTSVNIANNDEDEAMDETSHDLAADLDAGKDDHSRGEDKWGPSRSPSATPSRTPSPTPPPSPGGRSSSPSGSDYEKTQTLLEAQRLRTSARRRSPAIEDLDAEDDEQFEQDIQSKPRKHASPMTENESEESSDDESGRPSKKSKLNSKSKASDASPTTDNESDKSSGEERRKKKKKKVKSKATTKSKSNGKRKAVAEEDLEKDDPRGDGENDDATGSSFKPGPIPDAAKDAAFIAHAEYQRRMQQIANEYKKPVRLLYQLVGQGVSVPRFSLNGWNAFQAWYGVHGDETKPKDTTPAEWTKVLVEKYEEHLQKELGDEWENPKARAECLEPIVEWYKERLGDYIENMRADGNFKKVMLETTEKFVQYSAQAFELYGVHVFGFAINADRDEFGISHSTAWGALPAYAELRKSNKTVIARQLADYEAMFRVEEMKERGVEVTRAAFIVQTAARPNESGRDRDRRVFVDNLRGDLGVILVFRKTHSIEECKKMKILWVAWADLAYEKQVCLINWPSSACVPGKGFDLKMADTGMPHSVIKENNAMRLQAEVDDTMTDYVKITSWSDGELPLPPDRLDSHVLSDERAFKTTDLALADVPLVVTSSGRVVMTVVDSLKYRNAVTEARNKAENEAREGPKRKTKSNLPKSKKLAKMLPINLPSNDEDDVQAVEPPMANGPSRRHHRDDEVQELERPTKKRRQGEMEADPTARSSRSSRPRDAHKTTEAASYRSSVQVAPPAQSTPGLDPALLKQWAEKNGYVHDSHQDRSKDRVRYRSHSRSSHRSHSRSPRRSRSRSPRASCSRSLRRPRSRSSHRGYYDIPRSNVDSLHESHKDDDRRGKKRKLADVENPVRAMKATHRVPEQNAIAGPSRVLRSPTPKAGPSRAPRSRDSRPHPVSRQRNDNYDMED